MTENTPENIPEIVSEGAPENAADATSEVFVVRNQLGHYWGKSKAWVDGTEPKAVMRAKHQDEAINTLFELSSGDVELRGEVLAVTLSDRGEVVVEPSEHLLPKEQPQTPGLPAEEIEPAAAGASVTEGEPELTQESVEGLN